jgi:D-serine deaminase-like pyridoxal phosphate-dependent protein
VSHFEELDTPTLLIDLDRLDRNIDDMAEQAAVRGVALRPHMKTHKLVEVARRQLCAGAIGLTTAKLAEAEAMAAAGFDDLFVCYPLIGPEKLRRLRRLAREVRVSTVVDSREGARALAAAMAGEERPLDVLIKLDAGMHRIGVAPADAPELAAEVSRHRSLHLRGVCVHEGSVYAEPDPERRAAIARAQVRQLVSTARELERAGHEIEVVSAGATPAAAASLSVEGITEFRPGNYVFYDATQVALGVVGPERCAQTVLTTVVSRHGDRAVIDAGSKALTLDRGGHGTSLVEGHGIVRGRPGITVRALSEEHGWLALEPGEELQIGERLELIANHACPVTNCFPEAVGVRDGAVCERWTVVARGRMT